METWQPETFIQDPALNYEALKPAEVAVLMTLLDSGASYKLSRNMHPTYLAVRDSRVLLGPSNTNLSQSLMETTIRAECKRVGWTRTGIQCMVEEENVTIYPDSWEFKVNDVGSFVARVLRTSPKDDIMIESTLGDGQVSAILRIQPMARLMPLVVMALEDWGLTKISLNSETFYAIFATGLTIAIEEGMLLDEVDRTALLEKLDKVTINLINKMIEMVAQSMDIEVVS